MVNTSLLLLLLCCCDLEPSWNNDDGGDLSNCCTLHNGSEYEKKNIKWPGISKNEAIYWGSLNFRIAIWWCFFSMWVVKCTSKVMAGLRKSDHIMTFWFSKVVKDHSKSYLPCIIFPFLTHCATLCNCNTVGYYSVVKIGQKSNVCNIYRDTMITSGITLPVYLFM